MSDKPRVLVKEKIADSGVDLLREHFDVDLGVDWDDGELADRIGEYEGIVIRSATKLTSDLIERADRMRVIGRAGIGVDNVDVPAATRRGIVVANAPQSNIVAAAEHTIALMLALARNIPQAHASLVSGKWERSKFGGVEVYEKTLGILGFGRIGQLVAERARGFGMKVIAYDPFVAAERYRELGVEKFETSEEVYERADFVTIHLPKTPETANWLNAEAFAQMKDRVRVINCARGELLDHDALVAALESGKVGGAALDVFPEEPITEHPLFGMPGVIVTPHLGASTTEAQDRAGTQVAEQVVAALTGGVATNAVNLPAIRPEDMELVGPFVPLCQTLGRLAVALAEGGTIDRIEVSYEGRLSELDTRLLTTAVLNGVLSGHTEEDVNFVNAPSLAEERGIVVSEQRQAESADFNELVTVAVASQDGERVEVAGTGFGPRNVPHLVSVYGQSFNIQMAPHFAFLRYADQPGMIGRVGSVFGRHGVNIASAAVGAEEGAEAVMAVTTDAPVPEELIDEIVSVDGFRTGRAVNLAL
ncbi:MAG: D-3-phosphoglycerate dehydrogenase / 2-oxoglutarate reductase [Solirubrobacteraceae bacterium]|nr:D-3-phosphoglycerate dehydrogenase / 2-oxoglutarate reductase [Solirubrobacteraceae bacterium]